MAIDYIQNGEQGLSVRTTLNQVIDKVNNTGAQLIGNGGIDLNPSIVMTAINVANGSFQIGETVTGGDSGTTGVISSTLEVSKEIVSIQFSSVSGIFTVGETITGGTSGATAEVSVFTLNDQTITLSGGSTYLITDVVVTNATADVQTVSGGVLSTETNQGGYAVTYVNPANKLPVISAYVSILTNSIGDEGALIKPTYQVVSQDNLYLSFLTPEGTNETADIYIYGYILA